MWIRVNNLILDIEEDINLLKTKAAKRLKIKENQIKDFRISKESIDARKKNSIKFNYCVEVNCDNMEKIVLKADSSDVKIERKI